MEAQGGFRPSSVSKSASSIRLRGHCAVRARGGALDEIELQNVLEACKVSVPEAPPIERVGKWHLYSEKPNREPGEIARGGPSGIEPTWWPSDRAITWSVHTTIGGKDPSIVHPQIRAHCGVPFTGYLNPAPRTRNRRSRGSASAPFVLALDVANLANPQRSLSGRELPAWFETWTRFSGVLLFAGPLVGVDRIMWTWDFLANPHANYKVPKAMLKGIPDGETAKVELGNAVPAWVLGLSKLEIEQWDRAMGTSPETSHVIQPTTQPGLNDRAGIRQHRVTR